MKKINKIIAVFVTTMVCLSFLASCGKKQIEYHNSDKTKPDTVSGALGSQLDIPTSYKKEFDVGDSGLKSITLDVEEINVPSADSLPYVQMSTITCDKEYKKKIAESLFDVDKGIYVLDLNNYEISWKPALDLLKQMYTDAKEYASENGKTEDVSTIGQQLDYVESLYSSAVDNLPGAADFSSDNFVGYVGDRIYELDFYKNQDTSQLLTLTFSPYPYDAAVTYRPKEGAVYVSCWGADGEEEHENLCEFDKATCDQLGQTFLTNIGLNETKIVSEKDLEWNYYDVNYSDLSYDIDGYEFVYGISVNNTKTYNFVDYSYSENGRDDEIYDGDIAKYIGNSYTLQVDGNGIYYAYVECPMNVSADSKESNKLMSFDEAMEAADKVIGDYYKNYPSFYEDVAFNTLSLGYTGYTDPETGEQQMIPVWVFTQNDDGSSETEFQMFMLNAVDGSYIEP